MLGLKYSRHFGLPSLICLQSFLLSLWRYLVKSALTVFGLLGLAALSGCSVTKCESVCLQFNSCTVSQRDHRVDCPEFCADIIALESTIQKKGMNNCHSKFETHLDCWRKSSKQICNAEYQGCEASATEWTDCLSAYCDAHGENDPSCVCVAEDDDGTCTARATAYVGFTQYP